MEKIRVLLADTDEKYLMALERKFIDGFEGRADINIITDAEYLNTFFGTPQYLDILVINDGLYNRSFERHDIANIFILSEQMLEEEATGNLNDNYIYKYTSVKEIFNEVVNNLSINSTSSLSNVKETRVISVYSPIGGIGTTSMAVGLSAALAKNHKKVLFISTDSLQSFSTFFIEKEELNSGVEKQMVSENEYIYDALKPSIRNEIFDYIPPFRISLSSLNITMTQFINLINSIKVAKDYDYIVVEATSVFTEGTSSLMGYSNHVIVVTGQDRIAAHKLVCLLKNIDCSDSNRFMFVCNKYNNHKENVLVAEGMLGPIRIDEYVDFMEEEDVLSIERLLRSKSIQKLAMIFT